MLIPNSLDWMRSSPAGRRWLADLPDQLEQCCERWGLHLGAPYDGSYVSYVLPAVDRSGEELVLKIRFPDRESRHESVALRTWDGNGAVRLIAEHKTAMLLERCTPGRHLSTAGPDEGLRVLIGLLPRLWVPPDPTIGTLSDEVALWTANLPGEYERAGEPFEMSLLDDVMTTLAELASTQGEAILLHQDLHGDNVLSATREPWLVIDPKPVIGEREFGLSPIIRSAEFGHSKEHVLHRLDRLTTELDLDRDRARLWAACQAVAWGFENDEVLPGHIETARWLLAG